MQFCSIFYTFFFCVLFCSFAFRSADAEDVLREKGRDRDKDNAVPPPSSRGVWKYTVGLVGKPSAGKVFTVKDSTDYCFCVLCFVLILEFDYLTYETV